MSEDEKVVSLAGWKKAREHTILLPSGSRVAIVIPDLAALIETGHIPQNLLDAALATTGAGAAPSTPTKEFISQEREFTNKLVQATVVRPKLSDDDLDEIPVEDKAMIVEFATRQRDMDAEFSHIGGLHTSKRFRELSGLDSSDETLASL